MNRHIYQDVFLLIHVIEPEKLKGAVVVIIRGEGERVGDSIYSKLKKRVDPGDCGAPCDDERKAPRKPLSDAEMERQRRRLVKGPW